MPDAEEYYWQQISEKEENWVSLQVSIIIGIEITDDTTYYTRLWILRPLRLVHKEAEETSTSVFDSGLVYLALIMIETWFNGER